MPPIPTKGKNNRKQTQLAVSASNVLDSSGKSLDSQLRRQSRINLNQELINAANSQYASICESKTYNNRLVYRNVFPGRNYILTMSDTTWMGGDNIVTVGYTVGKVFTQLYQTSEPPEHNIFNIEIPAVAAVDALEVRLTGAYYSIKGYLEDATSSSGISATINRILDRLDELEQKAQDLEDRVTALEDAQS